MPGLQDSHQEALREAEERFPDIARAEPSGFRSRQAIVLGGILLAALLGFIAYVVLRSRRPA